MLLPGIQNIHKEEGNRYKRIMIPYIDELMPQIPIAADIETAIQTNGNSIMRDIESSIALSILDSNWKEHLRNMDELKDSVQSASFEQKDPLVIYKMEAYKLFETLVFKMNSDITSYLAKGKLMFAMNQEVKEAKIQKSDFNKTQTNKSEENARRVAEAAGRPETIPVQTIRNTGPKIGRNDSCPCGSGKKYKNCHGVESL